MPELAKSKDQRQFTLTAKVAFVKTVPVPAFKNNDFDIFELTDGAKKALIGFTYNKTVSPMADYQAKKEANRAMVQSLKKGGSFTITISISSFALLSDAQPAVLHAATPTK